MFYFAYGSNMSSRRLALRIGRLAAVGVGRLDGYRLRFHKVGSLDASAKCDVVCTGRDEDVVYGVILDIPEHLSERLDRFEGLGKGYDACSLTIRDARDRELRARTYIATLTDSALRPFHWYKQHVLNGAREHGLPADYIAGIASVPSIADPDSARSEREMAAYYQTGSAS